MGVSAMCAVDGADHGGVGGSDDGSDVYFTVVVEINLELRIE